MGRLRASSTAALLWLAGAGLAQAVSLTPPAAPGPPDPPPDPWSLVVEPSPARAGPTPLGAPDRPRSGLGALVFPALDHAPPLSPSPAHDAVAPPRPEPFTPPTASAPPPLEDDRDAEQIAADEDVSVFARLMRAAPDEVREGARYGLRDVLAAGIAVHAMGLGEARSTAASLTPAALAAIESAGREIERDEQRRGLILLAGLCAAVIAIAAVRHLRRQRAPRPLRSRRFG